jgi:hypothetical protein
MPSRTSSCHVSLCCLDCAAVRHPKVRPTKLHSRPPARCTPQVLSTVLTVPVSPPKPRGSRNGSRAVRGRLRAKHVNLSQQELLEAGVAACSAAEDEDEEEEDDGDANGDGRSPAGHSPTGHSPTGHIPGANGAMNGAVDAHSPTERVDAAARRESAESSTELD